MQRNSVNACGKDALQRQTQAETDPRILRKYTLRDALAERPCDPGIAQASGMDVVAIGGLAVIAITFFVVYGKTESLPEALLVCAFLLAVVFLIAGRTYLGAFIRLRNINRAMQYGKCVTAEILGCEETGRTVHSPFVAGIRLPDGTEFFTPRYHTSLAPYNRCDVYIYKHTKYLTNFRHEQPVLTEEQQKIREQNFQEQKRIDEIFTKKSKK